METKTYIFRVLIDGEPSVRGEDRIVLRATGRKSAWEQVRQMPGYRECPLHLIEIDR